ncbi:MAG: pirin-related protein [Hyphomicrobiales bacterium]|nr:pirin-related protein [Hyphomicrobiales bacterium]
MSTILRSAQSRGHANHGWLDSFHTFSFADYHDAAHMGFGPLRVINEDRVEAGAGFGTHGHRDMEIFSYVIEGALEHKDSIGTGSVIRPGDVQVMSAGTGIRHSEFNHSKTEPVHFLQIWLLPDRENIKPRYHQKAFTDAEKRNMLRLIASKDARDGSVLINQDADIYASLLDPGVTLEAALKPGRRAWVQLVAGSAVVNGVAGKSGDGFAISGEPSVSIAAQGEQTEVLVFDLP